MNQSSLRISIHSDGPCFVIHTFDLEQGYMPLGTTLVNPSQLIALGSATVHCQLNTVTDLRLFDIMHLAKYDTLEQPWY